MGPRPLPSNGASQKPGSMECDSSGYVRGADKIAALRTADVYLFPTEYGEGLPISILEAMAMQLQVVTRPVGGIADFFVDGEMGFVSDSVDPTVFADLVERLIDDRQLRLRIG